MNLLVLNRCLEKVRKQLERLSGDDPELLFAYRRKLAKELIYDERSKPIERRKLKELKRRQQNGICPVCSEELPPKYAELDRLRASAGYTPENTRLVHHRCHIKDQEKKGYR
jgi:DNA repair exonuclease SbcCD ATPase subunit